MYQGVRNTNRILLAATTAIMMWGCGDQSQPYREVLRLATTTTTQDSGLLEIILPPFEKQHRVRVDVISTGTGKALKLGEQGDVDAVLVHARDAEQAFMDAGHGIRHEPVMYNYFHLVGPADDPAKIESLKPAEALRRIADQEGVFLSRGDDSGTHKRELQLWESTGARPQWPGYIETGQGMGQTLIIADEKQGYTLSDRGSYLHFRDKISLVPLSTGSEEMRNPYAVIVINPNKHAAINADLADKFVNYLISEPTQHRIEEYQINGKSLFYPANYSDYH